MDKNNWTYKKLGEVATFSRGLTYSKKDVAEDTSKKVLRSNNIDLATNSLNYEDIAYLKEDFVIPEDKILHKNDIFICMSNGSTKHLGKVAFIETEADYAFGGFMGAIHPKTSEVFPKFAFYFCLSNEYRRCLATVLNGININNIKWSDLSKFSIPIPPLAEQERIVAELDLLSSIIDKKKAQLKEYDQLAQSIFYDMFGDPITNEKGWEVKKLKDSVQEMFLGPFGSALKVSCYVPESDAFAMVYEQKHAIQGTLEMENHFINKEKFDSLSRFEVKPKDFIMSCRGTIGRIFQLPENAPKGIIHPSLMKIRIKDEVYGYTFFVFLLKKIIAEQTTKGNCVQMAITAKELGNMDFPLPPLPLQQEFASKVEAIERQKALIQQSIDEVQTLFDSRMDYWFG